MSTKQQPSLKSPQENGDLSTSAVTKEVPARILKKRESDRRCQRIKREKTKSKIAALEEKVRNFGNQDSTGQVHLLMKQLQNVERERDELAKKVKTIETVIKEGEDEELPTSRTYLIQGNNISGYASPSTAGSFDHDGLDQGHQFNNAEPQPEGFGPSIAGVMDTSTPYAALTSPVINTANDTASSNIGDMHDVYLSGSIPTSQPQEPHLPDQNCECCSPKAAEGAQFNTWRFTNEVLSSRFSWPAYFQLLQDNYGDDTPVRAVVEGWDAIEERGIMHPSWQILKKIDETLFQKCKPKERLAVMYAIQLLLMSHTSPETLPQLPGFYAQRPSQRLADSYAIHFFPWPGMRERFVFNQHRYCTNNFWNTFIPSLRLVWPFEFRDCYTVNVETGMYSLSPIFVERVNDIKCWTMDSVVFEKWPELRADIPVYNSIPAAVSNMVRRSRPRKALPPASDQQKVQDALSNTTAVPNQVTHTLQVYSRPGTLTSPPYYPQPPVYNVDQKNTPLFSWSEDTALQAQESLNFYMSMSSSVNISTSY